jgi:hypothetical protein
MSIPRYCPIVPARVPDSPLERLGALALSKEGAQALPREAREFVFDAIDESERSLRFLQMDDERVRGGGSPEFEYRQAAGRRALWKIYAARDALNDTEDGKWPSDPLGLHNWRPGTVIPRDNHRT